MKLSSCLLAFGLLSGTIVNVSCSQKTETKTIATLSEEAFELKYFDISPVSSSLLDINRHGHVVGFRETMDATGTIFSQKYFFSDGKDVIDIPVLEGFTNTEVQALSDTGIAIGFASRPMGHPGGGLTAIAWDSKTNELTNLGAFPGDISSQAQDISADGTRVSGYTTGAEPARLRPCIWNWKSESKSWECELLATHENYNPYLMSGSAILSPDGKRVAACVTEAFLENGTIDSSLYVWTLSESGWQQRLHSQEQAHLHAMNNAGVIVADILQENGGKAPCYFDTDGKLHYIDLLPGDVAGTAYGVNVAGIIVGVSDDPHGTDGGPQAFIWKDGKTQPLIMPKETMFSTAMAINDRGQIAGFADVTLPDQTEEDPETGQQIPLVKAMGIIWAAKSSD